MADFGNVHNVEKFKRDGDALLRQVIGNFFSAEVELFYYPTNELLQRFGVNIQLVPLRNVYRGYSLRPIPELLRALRRRFCPLPLPLGR